MRAISKTRPAPGLEIVEAPEPQVGPGQVKVKIRGGSVCGTDLHIYHWDAFSSGRIIPPRIIGHEFCGDIIEVGEGVDPSRKGQFIASESHIVCGKCPQCLAGDAHVCVNTKILGIDVEGGFAGYAVIPQDNARPVPAGVPNDAASMLDALGNAVHTVMDGAVEGQKILITGLGPIGLMAAAICRTLGAAKIYGTEVRPYRKQLGEQLGVDVILDPTMEDPHAALSQMEPKGVDAVLEMSGHPSALGLAVNHVRPGGRVSLLGLYAQSTESLDINQVVMKGLKVHGIVGRKLWETWDQMSWLLTEKNLNILPVITHRLPFEEMQDGFKILEEGKAGKIVFDFENAR